MNAYQPKTFPWLDAGLDGLSQPLLQMHVELYNQYVIRWNEEDDSARPSFLWNAIKLHENFFDKLHGEGLPPPELHHHVQSTWGSWGAFLDALKAAAMSVNPGWVLLLRYWPEGSDPTLRICSIEGHDIGVPIGHELLFALDAWEHAYGYDYGIAKEAYLQAALDNVEWARVGRYSEAQEPVEAVDRASDEETRAS